MKIFFFRDIVRHDANYFVSNDADALKKLQFIYQDTILQEEEEEEEELPVLKFDPITMDINSLKEDIFNTSLKQETRINASLLLRQSNYDSFIPTLLKAIQEKDNNLRCGFVVVLIWGKFWDGKTNLLSSLLLTDHFSNVKSCIVYYLEDKGKYDFDNNKSVIELLINALEKEQDTNVISTIIEALTNYKSIALSYLLKKFDYTKKQNCNILNQFLNNVDKNILVTKQLVPLLKSPNIPLKTIIIKHLGQCYFPEAAQSLNILLNDKNLNITIQHYTEMSLRSIQQHNLSK